MRCPTLADLPSPPAGKTGWPWTVETPQLPVARPDGTPWPRISIVTPSYNQGPYIEETIRSVLLQGYPDLEYIVIDGGSIDGAVDIIRKYAPWLTYWVSEPDRGQAHAINKGVQSTSGEFFNWINSDDLLLPAALSTLAQRAAGDLIGAPILFFGAGADVLDRPAELSARNLTLLNRSTKYLQLGCWYKLDQFKKAGLLDESLHYAFDLDHVIRYLYLFPSVLYLEAPIGRFRCHSESKTCSKSHEWPNELLRLHQKLAFDPRYAGIAENCVERYEEYAWYLTVERYRTSTKSRIARFVGLIAKCLVRPRPRLNRYALGAARQIIFNSSNPKNV